jgi:hypothetical protein
VLLVALLTVHAAHAASRVQAAPVPQEMQSSDFTVKVDGRPIDVTHAAASYSFVSFDLNGAVTVEVTASKDGFWDTGVDVEPWRLGIRPIRDGKTIRFRIDGPEKISISRPGDFLNHATMLFVFAGTPPAMPPIGPNVHIVPEGVHRGSLNPQSGDIYYLAPGAFIFGSLNLWKVQNVKVLGRGTIVYEGPQDPNTDEGWMQKPDWHCIGAMEAHNVEIDGLTCIVRSRTWSIQMKDSTGFVYNNLRVMGGNPGNANQDGMDWLGGGDTEVHDSFLRASDDVFAMQGNWDGYTQEDLLRAGHDVRNILIDRSVLSTSISNIVRAQWPQKTFNSQNFTLRNSDVLHAGLGACGQTFGLLGLWGAKGAGGNHSNYTFENIFLEHWYSLAQMEQANPSVRALTFRNIWAPDQPPLEASNISGDIDGVMFDNVKYGQSRAIGNRDLPLNLSDDTKPATFMPPNGVIAQFNSEPKYVSVGERVTFTAKAVAGAKYTWLFGDGTVGHGQRVVHRFMDADGTELDAANGAGRFRVMLHVEDKRGKQDWAAQSIVAVAKWHDAIASDAAKTAGVEWRIYPGTWTVLPDLSKENPVFSGEGSNFEASAQGYTRYAVAWDGLIDVPADGGYTFHLIDRDGGRLVIDAMEVAKTGPPFAQVCGSPGNALRYARGSLGLRAGLHRIHVEGLHSASNQSPRLMWEGPAIPLGDVPSAAFSHVRRDVVGAPTSK